MMSLPRTILNGWTVLVVDDEPDNLEVVVRILCYYGATVLEATNGKVGLEIAKAQYPRLIISDISMPVMDGWQFVYELKRDRALMDIPAIALTAHAMLGDRERAISAGFHNYLTKPLTAKTFITDLLKLLIDIPAFTEVLSEARL